MATLMNMTFKKPYIFLKTVWSENKIFQGCANSKSGSVRRKIQGLKTGLKKNTLCRENL
ncbi:hypothetical protein M23134_06915 [Microscilla marina ATCC 23134]|uniref:Uncharacterized protein n=1 Tax=Microscilla marina ATCC 23134 TaxID=313606 RepID=A1ZQA5_MICM2|nr:hypothetical protein M23134_06915 [Microscilla marina ATCC 23134]